MDGVAQFFGLMLEQRLSIVALQETERLREFWDELPDKNSFSILAPSDVNGVGFVMSNHLVSSIQNSHIAREFGLGP